MIAAVLLLGPLAAVASAHTTLESSRPADGANADAAPESIELVFSQAPLGVRSVTVTAPDATAVTTGEVRQEGARVIVPLGALPEPGRYTVAYEVVAADGHLLEGTISFTLDAQAATAAGPATDGSEVRITTVAAPAPAPAPATSAPADTETTEPESDDERDIGNTVLGTVIVLAILVGLFLLVRRLVGRK